MLRHHEYTRTRIKQLANRLERKIYPQTQALDELLVAGPVDERIGHDAAMKLDYRPASLGMQLGPDWSTFWFRAKVTVPAAWQGQRVDLLWTTWSENTLWVDGRAVQGLCYDQNVKRPDALLVREAAGGETLEFAVETACNQLFGLPGDKAFRSLARFVLDQAEIARFDPLAWRLYYDLAVLQQLEDSLSKDQGSPDRTFAGELLFTLNQIANAIDEEDRGTWQAAIDAMAPLYARRNAEAVHELSAIGHAHIDTAWLWPLAETTRKCQRTFATATRYMADYPEYRFSCSQAYQYDTIQKHDPDLYRRIEAAVKAGQWIPVGGTWIEPDCNVPSGEALCRQFLYGQRFFERAFGKRCREFWNPDVFGYNGQLPQIMRQAGITRFLTQKLSWNWFNKPHFHTFTWRGIDGSEVLAHFPPADTYNANCDPAELRKHASNYKDADRSRHAFYLYGHGDGGGGPTLRMLECLRRAKDLQGLPRCTQRSSDEFFELLERDVQSPLTIVGELYFELHRGTYTSQALVKRNNRKSEILMHDLEFLAAVGTRLGRGSYDAATFERLWKIVLLNQFHDILPGSSITLVYNDSAAQFKAFFDEGQPLRKQAAQAMVDATAGGEVPVPVNTSGVCRSEVAKSPDGKLVFVEASPYGIGHVIAAPDRVSVAETDDGYVLENAQLRATLGKRGDLVELFDKTAGRHALAPGQPGNVLELYDDQPTNWEAWDVEPPHLETGRPCPAADSSQIAQRDPLRAEVVFARKVGKCSTLSQVVRLDAGAARLEFHTEVDWHESKKMLKAAFPVNVQALTATYEMQFGSVERPTHYNDSIALAKFEVPGHRWADLSEHGYGVALLTDCKYGYSTRDHVMRISLLRSPKSPDPQADMGNHRFAYAIAPHTGRWQDGGVVAQGITFNMPLAWASAKAAPKPVSFFSADSPDLIIDTVKKAEDSDAVVVRLYECHGARGRATLRLGLPFTKAVKCNILEDDDQALHVQDNTITLDYTPYQLISLKLS